MDKSHSSYRMAENRSILNRTRDISTNRNPDNIATISTNSLHTSIKLNNDEIVEGVTDKEGLEPSPSCLLHIYLAQTDEPQNGFNTIEPAHQQQVGQQQQPHGEDLASTKLWKNYYDDIRNPEKLPIEIRPIKPPPARPKRSLNKQESELSVIAYGPQRNTEQNQNREEYEAGFEDSETMPKRLIPKYYSGRNSIRSDSSQRVYGGSVISREPKFYNGKNSLNSRRGDAAQLFTENEQRNFHDTLRMQPIVHRPEQQRLPAVFLKPDVADYIKVSNFKMAKTDSERRLLSPSERDKTTSTPNLDTPTRIVKKEVKKNIKQTCCLAFFLILLMAIVTAILVHWLCKLDSPL